MKRICQIFAYAPGVGVVAHRVLECRNDHIVRESGFTGERLCIADLDSATARYFTTSQLAIEAFIYKAEVALADSSRAAHYAGWRKALVKARSELRRSGL